MDPQKPRIEVALRAQRTKSQNWKMDTIFEAVYIFLLNMGILQPAMLK